MAGFGGTHLGKMLFHRLHVDQQKPLLEKAGAYRSAKNIRLVVNLLNTILIQMANLGFGLRAALPPYRDAVLFTVAKGMPLLVSRPRQ